MNTDSIPLGHIVDSILSTHNFSQITYENGVNTTVDSTYSWAYTLGFFIPFIGAFAYLGYKHWQVRKWKRGTFPGDLAYSKSNLMEAYSSLTVHFITLDRFHQMQKIAYLKLFFIKHFKQIPERYDEIIDRNFHYPIHPESVVNWINQHANEQRKKQLIQFLVGLCHIDGTLKQKEYNSLKVITLKLQLDLSFLESTIFSYRGNKKENNERKSNHRVNAKPPPVSNRKKYADILGVSENAGVDEIKKRHRQLVKLYHPDKYARESKEKQEQAHQRFLEIQEAYEFLMKTNS